MIVVTVDRDGLDRGTVSQPFRIDPHGRSTIYAACIRFPDGAEGVYFPDAPRMDGARLWIECDKIEYKHDPDDELWWTV